MSENYRFQGQLNTPRNLVSLFSRAFPLSVITCDSIYHDIDQPQLECRIANGDDYEGLDRVSIRWESSLRKLLPDKKIPTSVKMVWEKVTWGDGTSETDWQIQDEFESCKPPDVVGWVSWLRGQIPKEDQQTRRPITYHHMPNTCRLCWNWAGKSEDPNIWDGGGPFQFVGMGDIQYNVPDAYLQYILVFPHPTTPDAAIIKREPTIPDAAIIKCGGNEILPQSLIDGIEDGAVKALRALGDEPVTTSLKEWGGSPVHMAIIEEIKRDVIETKLRGKGVSHIFVNGQTYSEIREFLMNQSMDEGGIEEGQLILYGASVCIAADIKPGKFTINARHFVESQHR